MKKYIYKAALGLSVVALTLTSCEKILDLQPLNEVTSEVVYANAEGYKQSLAKVYGSFATTGNAGPAGQGERRSG